MGRSVKLHDAGELRLPPPCPGAGGGYRGRRATEIARSMVARFGMGGRLGPVTCEADQGGYLGQVAGPQRRYAEETAREIDMEVRALVDGAFQRARLLLLQNRDLLVEGARRLLEKETLSDGELAEVLGKVTGEVQRAA